MADVDTFVLVKGDGLALGHHLDFHGGNIFQGATDHPPVSRLTSLFLNTRNIKNYDENYQSSSAFSQQYAILNHIAEVFVYSKNNICIVSPS